MLMNVRYPGHTGHGADLSVGPLITIADIVICTSQVRPNAEVIGPDRVGKDDDFGMPTNRAPVNLPCFTGER